MGAQMKWGAEMHSPRAISHLCLLEEQISDEAFDSFYVALDPYYKDADGTGWAWQAHSSLVGC